MTPERWQQVKQLFQSARDCAPEQRAAWVATACAGDDELRREVESLLAAHEESGNFLAQPVVARPEFAQEALISGQRIGVYQVEHKLGQGGMGMVYRAVDTRLGRPLALKLLHPHFTQDPERVRRFQQEARSASALNHPNILTIYEGGQVETTHFIATELVAGKTVRALLAEGELLLAETLDIVSQVLSALMTAHQAGIIHRDIKPENIMVRPDGIVKVLDFGLAKLTEPQRRAFVVTHTSGFPLPALSTTPGLVLGTVAYMSPEQARGVDVDARSDLFSVGVVLYELLTGRKPFDGETPSDVLAALLEREPVPLSQHRADWPTELQPILDRALAKSVEARYSSAQELLNDLKNLKQTLDFSAKLKQVAPETETVVWPEAELPALTVPDKTASNKAPSSLRFLTNYWQQQFLQRRAMRWAAGLALVPVLLLGFWLVQKKTSSQRPINSIAVLPFVNVGNNPQMEYLSEGLTESLIDSLMRLSSLRVMARSMVSGYRGREADPRQVGRDLQVQAIVTGRVQQQGERPTIRAELIDTSDGSQLWSREYQIPLAGLLGVQEEIAREVVTKLQLSLTRQEQTILAQSQTNSPEAYKLFLEGRYHWNKRTRDSMTKALESFQQAIDRDPNYALAHVGLADAYATLGSYHVKPAKEAFPRARAAAEKALSINANLAEAHATMGKVFTDYFWEWDAAESSFQRAISLNPKYANGHHWYSTLLVQIGRFDEAVREARLALDLDPLSPVLGRQLGQVLYHARRYDEGIVVLRKTLDLEPNHVPAHYYLGLCLLLQGKRAEALTAFQKGDELLPNIPDFLAMLGHTHAVMGQREQALRYQKQLHELAQRSYVAPYSFVNLNLGLGDTEEVFKWLEQCYIEHDPHLRGLKSEPLFDVIRTDSRFVALLRRVALPS